ncbi:MAG: hypothetical protein U5Q44_08430 [Dehalococcoidia bacterium]|nr:hypothetical protein [Dehalococcoidia bacterium]
MCGVTGRLSPPQGFERGFDVEIDILDVDELAIAAFDTAARVMEAALGDGVQVDIDDEQVLVELARGDGAGRRHGERRRRRRRFSSWPATALR